MFTKLKNYISLAFTSSFKLHIYMKSGNVIVCDSVTDWKLTYRGNEITGITLVQKFKGAWLIVDSLNLEQIEAVVRYY